MNNSNHSIKGNNSNNAQRWMMPPDRGPEPFNYMVSRPPNSVLPTSSHPLSHPNQQAHPTPPMQEEYVSPPAQAHEYDHPKYNNNKGGNRAVIPSKRAAQNRAAQKAFRQRREQYIKDLEIKAKEMEDWQEEMDNLKKENTDLRERILTLESQVSILTGGDTSKIPVIQQQKEVDTVTEPEGSRKSPIVEQSASLHNASVRMVNEEPHRESVSPVSITSSVKRSHNESRLRHEQQQSEDSSNRQQEGTFAPVPLRAPNQTGFESTSYHPDDHTPALIGNDTTIETKRRKLDNTTSPTINQQQQIGQVPMSTNSSTSYIQNTMIQSSNPSNSLPLPINNNNPIVLNMQQQSSTSDYWNSNSNIQQLNTRSNGGTMGDFDLDFDFDPFFEDEFGPTIANSNDFLPNANSGQVLDDLFAMLQTRQRPQIPIIPTDDNMDLSSNNNNNNSSIM